MDSLRSGRPELPFKPATFMTSKSTWNDLEKFARTALTRKENVRLEKRIRLREEENQDIDHHQ
ncbi:Retrovirus-related Pol polyprotein from type-1 retrotransposable element R1 [Aphis craccivora]|uniref:Retrovirus-related Pol polyprotein from type-1 retrotransposable element R1 n=1 Tax=Aphis craccivora TaxID=307492 RepID=A0A6G0X6G9_APHCR|nr:Retrovirus-related Pol polyprotein from type-1 retrotransposable element R1 [Aphis craccivora]